LNVSTGSATVTPVNGFFQTFTVSQATTIAFTQPLTGKVTVQLQITQATGTHYAITWTSVRWPSGQAPVLTAVDAAVDYVTCVLDGTHVDCTGAGAQAFQ
jgi:hypothetical protein